MRFWLPESFSENGARPVGVPGRWRPIGRLGALVFRPLDRHGNTIMGGRTPVRLTRIAGRAVSPADGPSVGKTFLPKSPLEPQTERVTRLPLESFPPSPHGISPRQRLDSPASGRQSNLAQETGRGRQASAIGCPVSFVRIITGTLQPEPSP